MKRLAINEDIHIIDLMFDKYESILEDFVNKIISDKTFNLEEYAKLDRYFRFNYAKDYLENTDLFKEVSNFIQDKLSTVTINNYIEGDQEDAEMTFISKFIMLLDEYADKEVTSNMKRLGAKDMTNLVMDKFEGKLDSLVDDAIAGKNFDYDDYIEMTAYMKGRYTARYFLNSDLYQEIQDYIDELSQDGSVTGDDYDTINALSLEFAMRLDEKIQDSIPYTTHRRVADTQNIHDIPASIYRALMQD